jgi:hypothetical protein
MGKWIVAYRTGGTDTERWHVMLGAFDRDEAENHIRDIRVGGRDAVAIPYPGIWDIATDLGKIGLKKE